MCDKKEVDSKEEGSNGSGYMYTEGVLDLSLPKKRQRSDSCSSHEAGTSSFSASSSSSSGEVEECQSENENAKDETVRMEFARMVSSNNYNNNIINNNNNNNSGHFYGVDNSDDYSPPSQKRGRMSPSQSESSLFSQVCRTDQQSGSNLNDPDLDEQPIQRVDRGVSLNLHDETQWNAFRKLGTEMIINRGGRRMFPHVVLSVKGLNSSSTYSIFLEIILADDRRFKYVNEQWMGMGMADPSPRMKTVVHPDSPNLGSYWMQSRISFSKVRLTNNKDSAAENILLLSMHKYKVVIQIRNESIQFDNIHTFVFDETAFVAVTAYQNSKITQLKIQNNPFAKAFRDAPSKQKTEGKKQNGGHPSKLDNDFSIFNVSPQKTLSQPTSKKDKVDVVTSERLWDPWFRASLGSNSGASFLPHAFDLTRSRYEGYGYPGMFMTPALMAQLSCIPYFSMTHAHLGQRLMRPASSLDSSEDSSPQLSSKDDSTDDSGKDENDDADPGSKSPNTSNYF